MSKIGELVYISNLHDNCKVTYSTNMPFSLRRRLDLKGAKYGIIKDNRSIIHHNSGISEAQVYWYNEHGKFLVGFRHEINIKSIDNYSGSHLIHLTDGNFDIDHIDKLLDQIANKL